MLSSIPVRSICSTRCFVKSSRLKDNFCQASLLPVAYLAADSRVSGVWKWSSSESFQGLLKSGRSNFICISFELCLSIATSKVLPARERPRSLLEHAKCPEGAAQYHLNSKRL